MPELTGNSLPEGIEFDAPDDEIYLQNAPLLRNIAKYRFHVPPADIDALVHDVFTTLFASPRRIHDLRAYLVGGICNASRQYWRRRDTERRIFVDVDDDDADYPTNPGSSYDVTRSLTVAATLARMGERCREILRRYYLEGEPPHLIAQAVNTSVRNVIYQLHVCRKRAAKVYETITTVKP